MLLQAPFDVVLTILEFLSPKDLISLSLCNKAYYSAIREHGWKHFFDLQKWNLTFPPPNTQANDWHQLVEFGVTVQKNWAKKQFSTEVISSQRQAFLPVIRFDSDKLVCGLGNSLNFFGPAQRNTSPKFYKQKSFIAHNGDITDISLCLDPKELFTCSTDGLIKRWFLNLPVTIQMPLSQTYKGHTTAVHSIYQFVYDPSTLFSVSVDGKLFVWNTHTAELCHDVQVPGIPRAMCGLTNGLIAVGNKSSEHLTLYKVTPSELVRVNSFKGHKSTVYALQSTNLLPHTFLSGCYDSVTRLFDLRTNSCVASFQDIFDTNPVFSVDYDHYRVVAGSSMHGVVQLWDLRYSQNADHYPGKLKKGAVEDGWSIFLGKTQRSPVYSLQLSHSKIVAALADQTWMLDFATASEPRSPSLESSRQYNFHRSRYRSNESWRTRPSRNEGALYFMHQKWNNLYETF
ncbi:hypothetical protein G9A89_006819 [Geosiphon pyriformis]|nr:hypothetical protein G9A89_006819 [Geosiphon pyriformis]